MTPTVRLARLATLSALLLSQLVAGLTVICDEGLGGQVMEFLLETCCEAQVEAEHSCADDSTCLESLDGDCGPCVDAPLTLLLQKQEEQHTLSFGVHVAPVEFPAAVFATPDLRATALRDTHRDGACGTVAEFSRTVVLTC